jgi:hypothetical protein
MSVSMLEICFELFDDMRKMSVESASPVGTMWINFPHNFVRGMLRSDEILVNTSTTTSAPAGKG